jgi:hypothetical protein
MIRTMRHLAVAAGAATLVVLIGLAGAAAAQDLAGEWQFDRQGHNGRYTGTLIVDRDLQARVKGRSPSQSYIQCGHVLMAADERIEIVFTWVKSDGGYSPDHFYCRATGTHFLRCINLDAAGHGGEETTFLLKRTGGLPISAADRLEGVCPAREQPQS